MLHEELGTKLTFRMTFHPLRWKDREDDSGAIGYVDGLWMSLVVISTSFFYYVSFHRTIIVTLASI